MTLIKVSNIKEWQKEVINSDVPVFVDFWADWCGPCRMVVPIFDELSKEYDGKVKFAKVNVDDANEIAAKYNVFSIPTLIVFKDGEVLSQQTGASPKDALKSLIDKALE
jgi:thioredoxin 1